MTTITTDLRVILTRDLAAFAREVELFPEDASLWRALPGIANPAGNLALHACGNLQHFVGGVLGRTGYVRERDQEFGARGLSRAEVAGRLRATADMVGSVLGSLPDGTLDAPYPVVLNGLQLPTQRFLLHLAVHLAFHLGQAGYLRRALTGDATTSGAVALGPLAST